MSQTIQLVSRVTFETFDLTRIRRNMNILLVVSLKLEAG